METTHVTHVLLCSALLCSALLWLGNPFSSRAFADAGAIDFNITVAEWQNNNAWFHVELFGTFAPPAITKIEIYYKKNNGNWVLDTTLATIAAGKTPAFGWSANFGNGYGSGDVLSFYAKLYYVEDGVAKTKDSSVKSTTIP